MKSRFKTFFKRLMSNISKPEMKILPGQLAFYIVLTFAPLAALFVTILGMFNLDTTYINDVMFNHLPSSVVDMLVGVSATKVTFSMKSLFWLVPMIYIVSNGMDSVIVASNYIYKLENEKAIKRRIRAIIMFFILALLLMFIVLVPVLGNVIFKIVGNLILGRDLESFAFVIFNLLRYPISFLLIYLAVKVLYVIAPNAKIDSKNVSYGAIFTTVLWIIGSDVYTYYVENYSNYSNVYGGISGVIILMLWVYFLSYVFVLGIGLNVSKYQISKDTE